MLYLLDTNTVSFFIKGSHPSVDQRLLGLFRNQWAISAISAGELLFGLQRKPEAARLHRLVNRFLDDATVLAWDAQAAAEHAKVRHTLRQRGQTIYHYDEMIAGHALALGAVLVTNNTKDFRRVDTLLLEDWTQPPRQKTEALP